MVCMSVSMHTSVGIKLDIGRHEQDTMMTWEVLSNQNYGYMVIG